jgi:hypothetical protein
VPPPGPVRSDGSQGASRAPAPRAPSLAAGDPGDGPRANLRGRQPLPHRQPQIQPQIKRPPGPPAPKPPLERPQAAASSCAEQSAALPRTRHDRHPEDRQRNPPKINFSSRPITQKATPGQPPASQQTNSRRTTEPGQRRAEPGQRPAEPGQRRAPPTDRAPPGGSGGSSPRINTASPRRSPPKAGEHRATPGGYGGKPPGVAIIGVPTGARNAGSDAPTGDQSIDMNRTRKHPPVCQDPITTRSRDEPEQAQSPAD